MSFDPYRPNAEFAGEIYDALLAEMERRPGRQLQAWIEAERQAVHRAAERAAARAGVPPPGLDQVMVVERCATGHVDYAAKWALGLARAMKTA